MSQTRGPAPKASTARRGRPYDTGNWPADPAGSESTRSYSYDPDSDDSGVFAGPGYDSGVFDSADYDSGVFDGAGYDKAGYDKAGYDSGVFDSGGFDSGGYAGRYDRQAREGGGQNNGGYDEDYDRRTYSAGSHDRPPYDTGGFGDTPYEEPAYGAGARGEPRQPAWPANGWPKGESEDPRRNPPPGRPVATGRRSDSGPPRANSRYAEPPPASRRPAAGPMPSNSHSSGQQAPSVPPQAALPPAGQVVAAGQPSTRTGQDPRYGNQQPEPGYQARQPAQRPPGYEQRVPPGLLADSRYPSSSPDPRYPSAAPGPQYPDQGARSDPRYSGPPAQRSLPAGPASLANPAALANPAPPPGPAPLAGPTAHPGPASLAGPAAHPGNSTPPGQPFPAAQPPLAPLPPPGSLPPASVPPGSLPSGSATIASSAAALPPMAGAIGAGYDPGQVTDPRLFSTPAGQLGASQMPPQAAGTSNRLLAIEAPRAADQGATAQGQRRPGENTRAVHLPPPPAVPQQPLATPVYRSSTFAFTTSSEYAAVLADAAPGFSYSRIDNPTVTAFCSAVAALEGVNLGYQVTSQAFASGMAAISTIFLAFTRAGAHVVASSAVYGGTYGFLRNVAANFGVQTNFVDVTDLGQVQAALRPGTSILYVETLANPTVAVADLAALAGLAHSAGALLIVDSTLAPPVVCRPLEHGADLVLHSATKYFCGHSDVTGGVVTGRPDVIAQVRKLRIDLGGSLAPDDAYTLRRGLETLPLRVRRQCATAQVVAAGLARHPAVSHVYYPGLTAHSGHELARRQFDAGPEGTRFGAIVTVAPYGGAQAGMAFADQLRLAKVAASLGGTHTKVSHVASTTHRQLDQAALKSAGIDPGSVRFSIGLEDAEDLLADAMAALDSLGRR